MEHINLAVPQMIFHKRNYHFAAATTVRVTAGLVTPDLAAVISVLPAATPVARPSVSTVAIDVLELVHVTTDEMSLVEPSE